MDEENNVIVVGFGGPTEQNNEDFYDGAESGYTAALGTAERVREYLESLEDKDDYYKSGYVVGFTQLFTELFQGMEGVPPGATVN